MSCGSRKHAELLTSLLEVMQDEAFSDLQLTLKDGHVTTSRSVLAAMSPVFRRMLTNRMREREEGEVRLDHVTLASWNVVVTFYLGQEELVTAENVETIVDIAHQYDMKSLEQHCSKVLSERSTVENCFAMLEIATKYGFADAVKLIVSFMGKNFEAVSSMAEFCSLPRSQLEDLLGRSLFVVSEDSVAKAVLSWLDQNQVDEETVLQLFSLITLADISIGCMYSHILYHPQVVSCSVLRDRVAKEIERRYQGTASTGQIYERLPVCSNTTIVLGYDGQKMRMFGARDPLAKWHTLPSVDSEQAFAASLLDGSIYVTGGTKAPRSTFIFNLEKVAWTPGPDLVQGRFAHAMTEINRTLYVVAGRTGQKQLSCIEELHPAGHAWTLSGSLQVDTFTCGAAAVGSTIIVAGGKASNGQKTIQAFDTVTRTATVIEARWTNVEVRARGVTLPDRAVFVCQDGDLVTVKRSAEGTLTVEHTQLDGFDGRGLFGLLVDSQIRIFGGNESTGFGDSLARFTLEGRKEEWNAAPLPVPLRVYAVFRTTVPGLGDIN